MISLDEYIKLREQPIDHAKILEGVEGRSRSLTVKRIFNYQTFGDLIDDNYRTSWLSRLAVANLYKILVEKLGIADEFTDALNDWENSKRKVSCLSHMGIAILSTSNTLEKQRKQLLGEDNQTQRKSSLPEDAIFAHVSAKSPNILENLNAEGISSLESEPCRSFSPRAKRYKFILNHIETYLNDLCDQMIEQKIPKDEIKKTIIAKMDEFKALVQRKREQLEHVKGNVGFLSQI